MKCSQRVSEVEKLGKEDLDPRKMISIIVTGKDVYLQTLHLSTRIAEKMSMAIPLMELPTATPMTKIRSIQMKNRLIVLEVDGPLNAAVKAVASVIIERMAAMNMVTAFFPGSSQERAQSQYYFGFGMNMLRAANPNVKNIRLLDDGQGVLFTQVGQLKKVALSQINENWVEAATIMHEFNSKAIAFLGRVHEKKVAVTMADSTTVVATLTRSKATVTGRFAFGQKIGMILGELQHAGIALCTAIRGRELTLTPVIAGE